MLNFAKYLDIVPGNSWTIIGDPVLATLFIWIYILVLSYLYGWTIIGILIRFFRCKAGIDKVSGPLIILTGICLINKLAALFSLFIKLGWIAQIILLIPGMAFGWRMWKKRAGLFAFKVPGFSWLVGILLVLVFFTVLENSTHISANPDTGIYHAQAIRWIETYPAVAGLGNLHSHLAFNSN